MGLEAELTTGLIAAGAALAGSGLALFADRSRRRWEDRRRWGDTKRVAFREYIHGTQLLYRAVATLARVRAHEFELSEGLDALRSAVAAGDSSQDRRDDLEQLRNQMAQAKREQSGIGDQVAEGFDRVREVEADLYLLCDEPVTRAVRAHHDLIMDIHRESKESSRDEVALVIPATAELF